MHWILSALGFKLLFLNGQENGLRSRGLVHPEHALCQLSYFLIKMGAPSGANNEQGVTVRVCMPYIVTLDLRLEVVFGEGLEPSSAGS